MHLALCGNYVRCWIGNSIQYHIEENKSDYTTGFWDILADYFTHDY